LGQLTLDGTVTSGPGTTAAPGVTPASTDTIPLSTLQTPKGWNVISGPNSRNLATAYGTYVTLSGIGATAEVTQGTFVYMRSSSPVQVRLTQANLAGGGDLVSVVQFQGAFVTECPDSGYLKLLEASGTTTLEWMVSGNI
jgi:hypothetical protein